CLLGFLPLSKDTSASSIAETVQPTGDPLPLPAQAGHVTELEPGESFQYFYFRIRILTLCKDVRQPPQPNTVLTPPESTSVPTLPETNSDLSSNESPDLSKMVIDATPGADNEPIADNFDTMDIDPDQDDEDEFGPTIIATRYKRKRISDSSDTPLILKATTSSKGKEKAMEPEDVPRKQSKRPPGKRIKHTLTHDMRVGPAQSVADALNVGQRANEAALAAAESYEDEPIPEIVEERQHGTADDSSELSDVEDASESADVADQGDSAEVVDQGESEVDEPSSSESPTVSLEIIAKPAKRSRTVDPNTGLPASKQPKYDSAVKRPGWVIRTGAARCYACIESSYRYCYVDSVCMEKVETWCWEVYHGLSRRERFNKRGPAKAACFACFVNHQSFCLQHEHRLILGDFFFKDLVLDPSVQYPVSTEPAGYTQRRKAPFISALAFPAFKHKVYIQSLASVRPNPPGVNRNNQLREITDHIVISTSSSSISMAKLKEEGLPPTGPPQKPKASTSRINNEAASDSADSRNVQKASSSRVGKTSSGFDSHQDDSLNMEMVPRIATPASIRHDPTPPASQPSTSSNTSTPNNDLAALILGALKDLKADLQEVKTRVGKLEKDKKDEQD
ncbi:hypothetical protein CVT26_011478, partial [Gymnopilus dilepis]